ncbi:MAG: hypothetical protein JXQ26_07970 [Tissierellales bacterium]|nr:hypothetical protein [Tissierellales bacterium]
MKKYIVFLFVFTIIIFIGCSKILHRTPKVDNFDKLDFTKYTEKGFLFTPLLYNGNYESVGLINYRFIPSASYKDMKTVKNGVYTTIYYWDRDNFSLYDLLDSVYTWSSSKGANAIVNLKLEVATEYFGYGFDNPATIQGLDVSGFAIKRK